MFLLFHSHTENDKDSSDNIVSRLARKDKQTGIKITTIVEDKQSTGQLSLCLNRQNIIYW